MFNAIRFGQMFSTRVANVQDVVQFSKLIKRTKTETVNLDKEALRRALVRMGNICFSLTFTLIA